MMKLSKLGIDKLAVQLLAISDPNRLKILCRVVNGEKACVSDIANELDLSVAITSYHLNELSDAGYLVSIREGKCICYMPVKSAFVADIKKIICKYR